MVNQANIRVLHVDDEPDFAELTADFLKREDDRFTVETAMSASGGLEHLSQEDFDCIISDYDMPGQNGIEFLKSVRKNAPDLPFVLFTGKGSEEIASEAISAGVTDYLQKSGGPDQFELLAKRVHDAVERYRSEERYHNLIDTAPVPIALFESDGCLRYANDAAVRFLEADSAEELLGASIPEFLHPDDRKQALRRFERLMAEDRAAPEYEFRIRALDGTVKRAVVATAPGYYRGDKVAQVIVRVVET